MTLDEKQTVSPFIPSDKLPCPRLEFRWARQEDEVTPHCSLSRWFCTYSLVLPLGEYDIRRTDTEGNPTEKFLEFGTTKISSGLTFSPIFKNPIDPSRDHVSSPYRDGVHAQWDNEALGGHLPVVAVCGNVASIVKYHKGGSYE